MLAVQITCMEWLPKLLISQGFSFEVSSHWLHMHRKMFLLFAMSDSKDLSCRIDLHNLKKRMEVIPQVPPTCFWRLNPFEIYWVVCFIIFDSLFSCNGDFILYNIIARCLVEKTRVAITHFFAYQVA